MGKLCVVCKQEPVYIQKWGLCRQCYQRRWTSGKLEAQVVLYPSEIHFIKNFFTHNNWLYHPVIFRLNGCNYEPDFYDGERNVFIEVVGARQAFSANFQKYELFLKTFPQIKFEVRNSTGEIRPLTKRNHRDCVKK